VARTIVAVVKDGETLSWQNTEVPSEAIVSSPPSGKCKVTNIFVDPMTGKCTVEYEGIPVP